MNHFLCFLKHFSIVPAYLQSEGNPFLIKHKFFILVKVENRNGVRMLYVLFYLFWKIGDLTAVSLSLGITNQNTDFGSVHNVSEVKLLFETKFEDMSWWFAVLGLGSSVLFAAILLPGEHHIKTR